MHTDVIEQPDNMNGMADAVQLASVFDSLNILSACAWIINKKVRISSFRRPFYYLEIILGAG